MRNFSGSSSKSQLSPSILQEASSNTPIDLSHDGALDIATRVEVQTNIVQVCGHGSGGFVDAGSARITMRTSRETTKV